MILVTVKLLVVNSLLSAAENYPFNVEFRMTTIEFQLVTFPPQKINIYSCKLHVLFCYVIPTGVLKWLAHLETCIVRRKWLPADTKALKMSNQLIRKKIIMFQKETWHSVAFFLIVSIRFFISSMGTKSALVTTPCLVAIWLVRTFYRSQTPKFRINDGVNFNL